MDFMTHTDVTEIIKAMVGQNAPPAEQFTDYMKEAAKACVEADRILSGAVNLDETPDDVSLGEPLNRLNDGIRAFLELLDEHKAAIELARWASLARTKME
jgi:hypothetical protein